MTTNTVNLSLTTNPSPQDAWLEIVLKLLDWPFLLLIALLVFILLFRKALNALLNRGDVQFTWGDRSIRLRDLSDQLDQDLDPIREDVEQLKKKLADAKATESAAPTSSVSQASLTLSALERMKAALADPKFRWRSIERLAVIGGVTEPEATDILRSDATVVFGTGKSGRRIARLVSR